MRYKGVREIIKIKPLEDWIKRGYSINNKSIYNYLTIDENTNFIKTYRGQKVVPGYNNLAALTSEQVMHLLGKEVYLESVSRNDCGVVYAVVTMISDPQNLGYHFQPIKAKIPLDMTNLKFKDYLKSMVYLSEINEELKQEGDTFRIGCKKLTKEEVISVSKKLVAPFGYKVIKK